MYHETKKDWRMLAWMNLLRTPRICEKSGNSRLGAHPVQIPGYATGYNIIWLLPASTIKDLYIRILILEPR